MNVLGQLIIDGIAQGAWIALMAVGFSVIHSSANIFHLAHAGSFVVAAYVFVVSAQLGMPLLAAGLVAAVLTGIVGIVMEQSVYSPLRRRGAPSVVIVAASFALFLLLQNVVLVIAGGGTRGMSNVTDLGVRALAIGGYRISVMHALLVCVAVITGLGLFFLTRRTKYGRWLEAVAANPDRAGSVGVNVVRVRQAAFGLGSAILVFPAFVTAIETGVTPTSGLRGLLFAVTAAIVGGLASMWASIAGGFIVGIFQSVSVYWVSGTWQQAVVFALLLAVLLIRPSGLFARELSRLR